MFLAGTNFVLSYFAFKGNVSKVVQDEEFKLYFKFIVIFTLIVGGIIYYNSFLEGTSAFDHPMVLGIGEGSFRHALFQVVAIVTTTGFVTADYTLWAPFLLGILFWIDVSWRFCRKYFWGGEISSAPYSSEKRFFRI